MTPELQDKLASILGFLETSVQSAQQFAVDQAPDIVQQLLRWDFVESLTFFIIGVILLVISCRAIWLAHKKIMASEDCMMQDFDEKMIAHLILALIAMLPVVIGTALATNLNWLKIWIAPKVYLLEYVSSLVK